MSREILDKIPWHKEEIEKIGTKQDITFGYLVFFKDSTIPDFVEGKLTNQEQLSVVERINIQKTSNLL